MVLFAPCGAGRAVALKSRAYTFECSGCGRQTSITAGTAMHRAKLPLTTWFWVAHLMVTNSNGMSAWQLEDQLGLTYSTAWLLTQKLRRSTVDPDWEPLERVVESIRPNSPSAKAMHLRAWQRGQNPRHRRCRSDRSRHQPVQAATAARQVS